VVWKVLPNSFVVAPCAVSFSPWPRPPRLVSPLCLCLAHAMSDQEIHTHSPSLSQSASAGSPPRAAEPSSSASATGSARCAQACPTVSLRDYRRSVYIRKRLLRSYFGFEKFKTLSAAFVCKLRSYVRTVGLAERAFRLQSVRFVAICATAVCLVCLQSFDTLKKNRGARDQAMAPTYSKPSGSTDPADGTISPLKRSRQDRATPPSSQVRLYRPKVAEGITITCPSPNSGTP
jgi:hypothetical protein